jgi:hypothetical protein
MVDLCQFVGRFSALLWQGWIPALLFLDVKIGCLEEMDDLEKVQHCINE